MLNKNKFQLMARSKYGFAPLLVLMCLLTTVTIGKAVNGPTKYAVKYNTANSKHLADTINNDTVFMKVDKRPLFPGGNEAYTKFIAKNIRYPEIMRDRQIEDDVMVKFIVEIDGSLTHLTALNNPGNGAAEEAIRLLKTSPKWKPGIKNGRAVRVLFKAPVTFRLRYIEYKDDNSRLKIING